MRKTIYILFVTLAGVFLPYFSTYSFLIRYFLMAMLFFSFLKIAINFSIFERKHFLVLAINIVLGILAYFLVLPIDTGIAQAAFVITIAPTGIASIIWADLFKADLRFLTGAIIVSNLTIILSFPLLATQVLQLSTQVSSWEMLQAIAFTIGVPMILSQVVCNIPNLKSRIFQISKVAFVFFLTNIFLATARVAKYLKYETTLSWELLLLIAVIIMLCAAISFFIGSKLSPDGKRLETELALGQKNTMLSIWLASTYLLPTALLGPMIYIILQNIYNSWQLYRLR